MLIVDAPYRVDSAHRDIISVLTYEIGLANYARSVQCCSESSPAQPKFRYETPLKAKCFH
jgi:hypothetical protein